MTASRYIDEINAIVQRERFEVGRKLARVIEDIEALLEDLRAEEEQAEFYADDFNDEDLP